MGEPGVLGHIVEKSTRARPDLNASSMLMGRIARLDQRFNAVLRPPFAAEDLGHGDFDVLSALRRIGEPFTLRPAELSRTLLVTTGAVSKRIDRLEGRGYVRRDATVAGDRRGKLIGLTDEGLALVDRLIAVHLDNEQRLLGVLTTQERATLATLLAKLDAGPVPEPDSATDSSGRLVAAPAQMPGDLLEHALAADGFMPPDEGLALHRLARERLPRGPALEVGTYCGKSAVYLGAAAREVGGTVLTVDHHRGSEENQAGWEHHDPTLVDAESGRMDTLPRFRRTIAAAGLDEQVVAVVGSSLTVSALWHTPLSLLFIDGGHGERPAMDDYEGWAPWVMPGGLLALHDVFPDPRDGGRPPYDVYLRALAGGSFVERGAIGSLRVLRRTHGSPGDPAG